MRKTSSRIVIDEEKGLIFKSEEDLYSHFETEIHFLEHYYFANRSSDDIPDDEFDQYEENLTQLISNPDEVWHDPNWVEGKDLFVYFREFPGGLGHIAVCYLSNDVPSFIYLHFPTRDENLVERFLRGVRIYQKPPENVPIGALEGDSLSEGDELAVGLYEAMLKIRGENDIPEYEFVKYAPLREPSLEEADEIWRSSDSLGNIFVTFVRHFEDEDVGVGEYWYLVTTLEDTASNSHALLFSFPTSDQSLVDRYRHGDNLQAEEVVQESSH